jgi:CheY-like chemotaxis protein
MMSLTVSALSAQSWRITGMKASAPERELEAWNWRGKKNPISSSLNHIPVIVVTGVSQITGVDFRNVIGKQRGEGGVGLFETSRAAPDGFVEKPIDPSTLVKTIQDVLKE